MNKYFYFEFHANYAYKLLTTNNKPYIIKVIDVCSMGLILLHMFK